MAFYNVILIENISGQGRAVRSVIIVVLAVPTVGLLVITVTLLVTPLIFVSITELLLVVTIVPRGGATVLLRCGFSVVI